MNGGDGWRCALVVGQHAARWVGACCTVGGATGLDGDGRVVGQGQGGGDRQLAVDGHVHIDQHLRLRGAVVVDLVVNAVERHFAFVGPGAGQAGVAHCPCGGHAVGGQGGQVEGVARHAVNDHLHFVQAAGGACGRYSAGPGANGGLGRARKAIRRHGAGCAAGADGGAGVGAAQRQHVVGRHRQHRAAALHLEDLDLLDAAHRLVLGQGVQVEVGACGQLEPVHARAAADHAACSECRLQTGAGGGDHIVAAQRVQSTAGVAQGVGAGGGACGECGSPTRRRWDQRQVVQYEVTVTVACGVFTAPHHGDVLGRWCRVGGSKVTRLEVRTACKKNLHTIDRHTHVLGRHASDVVKLQLISLTRDHANRRRQDCEQIRTDTTRRRGTHLTHKLIATQSAVRVTNSTAT